MTAPVAIRWLVLAIAALCLVALAWNGLSGGLRQLGQAHTAGQTAQTFTQLGYGLLSLLGVVTIFVGRRWNRLVLACWAICLSLAAGLASVVWGETGMGIGLAAAVAGLLIAAAIIWMIRIGAHAL